MTSTSSKTNISEVRGLIDKLGDKISLIREDIAGIKQQVINLCKNTNERNVYYTKKFDENRDEHKNFVSIRAARNLTVFLSIFITIITIVNTYLTFIMK